MNDPGVDEPISRAAQDVEEDAHEKAMEITVDGEEDFLDPRFESCKVASSLPLIIL